MRFVIQHHTNKNDHYDLMIETKGMDALLTFRINPADMDTLRNGNPAKTERIQDHRKEYLDYEGPVKSGSGSVRIFDNGQCETVLIKDDRFEFELNGRAFAGDILIKEIEKDLFEIQYTKFL